MTESTFSVAHQRLVSDVRYGYWFNAKCEAAYAHFALFLSLLQLVGGSLAVASLLKDSTLLSAWMGGTLAVAAALSLLVGPSVKAERHRQAKNVYLELEGRAWTVTAEQLQIDLAHARAGAPIGIALLSVPAFNATMRAIGAEDAQKPESFLAKVMAALA